MYGLRLISQSGAIDIPYEYSALHIGAGDGGGMYGKTPMKSAIYAQYDGVKYKMAQYSNREKAIAVLERIREFKGDIYLMPSDEDVISYNDIRKSMGFEPV